MTVPASLPSPQPLPSRQPSPCPIKQIGHSQDTKPKNNRADTPGLFFDPPTEPGHSANPNGRGRGNNAHPNGRERGNNAHQNVRGRGTNKSPRGGPQK